jgi:AsmA protein
VTISKISVAPFSGGIAIEGLAIADDPAFSREPFLRAKAVTVGVDLMPLILSRSLRVESFRLEKPGMEFPLSVRMTRRRRRLGSVART